MKRYRLVEVDESLDTIDTSNLKDKVLSKVKLVFQMPQASEFKKLGKLSITDPKKALSFAIKKAYKDDRKTGLSIIASIEYFYDYLSSKGINKMVLALDMFWWFLVRIYSKVMFQLNLNKEQIERYCDNYVLDKNPIWETIVKLIQIYCLLHFPISAFNILTSKRYLLIYIFISAYFLERWFIRKEAKK